MRQYANPPLVEAICEFQFLPGSPWDATVLGLVYERVKGEFPQKAQLPPPLFNLTIGASPQAGAAPASRMQFRRADNSALLQVGPDSLTVNHLSPYGGWPRFLAMIESALSAYREVAAPQGLKRLALRYINRICVPAALVNAQGVPLSDYVLTYPNVPGQESAVFSQWAQRVEILGEGAPRLVLQSGTAQSSQEFPIVILLDLEVSPADGQTVLLTEAANWLVQAHTRVEVMFEACLGPKARALFESSEDSIPAA